MKYIKLDDNKFMQYIKNILSIISILYILMIMNAISYLYKYLLKLDIKVFLYLIDNFLS